MVDCEYNADTRQFTIFAGHKIPMPCECRVFGERVTVVQHIASPDHVMSGADVFECSACRVRVSSSIIGPILYPNNRVVY